MVIAFHQKWVHYRKHWMGSRREFNEIVRESLLEAADYWIKNYMNLHFGPGATSRYHYNFRSKVWLEYKARFYPTLVLPAPFEFTGELMSFVMDNARSGRMLDASKAISTFPSKQNPSGKQRVKIPIRIPHPIHPRYAGELSRLLPSEARQMRRVMFDALHRRLKASPSYNTEDDRLLA